MSASDLSSATTSTSLIGYRDEFSSASVLTLSRNTLSCLVPPTSITGWQRSLYLSLHTKRATLAYPALQTAKCSEISFSHVFARLSVISSIMAVWLELIAVLKVSISEICHVGSKGRRPLSFSENSNRKNDRLRWVRLLCLREQIPGVILVLLDYQCLLHRSMDGYQ